MHKVQHKPIKDQVRDTIWNGAKDLSVLKIGAPNYPVCHRIVSGAPGPYICQPATLRNSRAHSAIIHRTTGLSGEPAEQRLSAPTVDSNRMNSTTQYRAEVRAAKSEGHRTVRCGTGLSDAARGQSSNCRTLTVGWRGDASDKEQCMSGGAPDCPVRPSPVASPMAMEVVGGYKYPPPPHS
jgi:hypothetical protein